MTRTLSHRLTAAAIAAVLMLGTWLPTLTVPADARYAATASAIELA